MKDILITQDFDLDIVNGDLAVGSSQAQQPQLLLNTSPGEWPNAPTTGVGIARYIEAADQASLARRIQTELTADGMRVDSININGSNIQIDASYGKI